jgi:hypothetical protein
MKLRVFGYWLLPIGALLLGLLPAMVHYQQAKRGRTYHGEGNFRLAYARGCAREYESKYGRRPDIPELTQWASEHLSKDLVHMKITDEWNAGWNDPPPRP